MAKIWKNKKILVVIICILYVVYNMYANGFSFTQAVGTTPGMNVIKLMDISKAIANDSPKDFNIVYTPNFDYRAYAMRYMLTYIFNNAPMDVTAYPNAKTLYVVSGINVSYGSPWEITSAKLPHITQFYITSDQKYVVYKMTK